MNQVEYDNLFESIKLDNLILFSSYIEGKENLCFGRFPILSLCYLFGAKKIAKEYTSKLSKIKNYKVVDENLEIFKAFRKVAGKVLRLYQNDDSMVSPVEILAILHEDAKLKKLYSSFNKNEIIKKNLKTIYTIYGQKVDVGDFSIEISKAPMSNYQKNLRKKSLILSSLFIVLLTTSYLIFGLFAGLGTNWNAFKVYNEKQLIMALNSGGNYVLTRDIAIDSIGSILTFDGEIDGDNHKIYVNNLPHRALINKNEGVIKNLNIIYTEMSAETSNSLSLFVNENNGSIDNVNIVVESMKLDCKKSESNDIYISSIATTNNGVIKDSNIKISGEFSATQNGECYFGGVVGKNNGIIDNCEIERGSELKTNEIDIGGIACFNEKGATIFKSNNFATISQKSAIEGWSPNVAGVVLTNYGLVEKSNNYANLDIVSSYLEESQATVFLGGIVAMNYGVLKECVNKGNLKVQSEKLIVYCGGISAYSSYYTTEHETIMAEIDNCGTESEINITTQDENAFVFAGGISGYLYGNVNNSYSLSSFVNGNNEDKYFIGSFIGSSYIQYQLFGNVICISASNNFVLDVDNVLYQIGSLINNGRIVSAGFDSTNGEIAFVDSLAEIIEKGVYINEEK